MSQPTALLGTLLKVASAHYADDIARVREAAAAAVGESVVTDVTQFLADLLPDEVKDVVAPKPAGQDDTWAAATDKVTAPAAPARYLAGSLSGLQIGQTVEVADTQQRGTLLAVTHTAESVTHPVQVQLTLTHPERHLVKVTVALDAIVIIPGA